MRAKSLLLACAAFIMTTPTLAATTPDQPLVRLLPKPAMITAGVGRIVIADGAAIAIKSGDAGLASAARLLADHVKTERGLTLSVAGDAGPIRFERDPDVKGTEAYRLTVTPAGIHIAASGDAGLVHGAMTLAQLMSPDRAFGQPVTVPALSITDAPRFGWRGVMVDVARHFQPLSSLYLIVDQMASVKLNVLHLHLTDDQGWRLEIKRYPKLTSVGGWRTPPGAGATPGPQVGGFYTQDELKGLVKYAQERGITIVPEIDLPGHAQALVAAYPEYGVFGDRPAVSHDWGVNPYLLNPGPKGVAFVKAVLDEVMDVFPGTYIHLGGDEAIKDQWQKSPEVQAQIKALGLKDENGLQSWLIDQFGVYLADHGRRLIGWDEILEGGLPPSASVMSWRGEQGAIDAANQNHDVVLSPAPTLYLDSLQSDRGDEPPGRLSIQTLANVYAYEPLPKGLDPAKAKHILGAQGNAWSEYLVTPQQVQHMIFPRIGALAETTWSSQEPRPFGDFLTRLEPQILRWRRSGVEVADSAFAVDYAVKGSHGDALRAGRTQVALTTQAPWGTIRYTLDGRTPTARSKAYAAPLSVRLGATIKAAAFAADGTSIAEPRTFDTSRTALLARTSSDLSACPDGAQGLRVPLTSEASENAPVFNINLFDTCSVYPAAPLDVAKGFTVDVARLPRHYGLAHDTFKVRQHYNITTFGELVVLIGCTDAANTKPVVAATFPLPDPATAPNRFDFRGRLPRMEGDKDICLQFTAPITGVYYAVEKMQLTERAE